MAYVKKIEVSIESKNGGEKKFRSRMCKTPEFCYDLAFILCPNHIANPHLHWLIEIKKNKVYDQNWKM